MYSGTLYILLSSTFYALSQWFVITLILKTNGAEDVGRYVLALAIVSPLMILAQFGLRQVWVTNLTGKFSLQQCLKLRILFSFLALAISFFFAIIFYEKEIYKLVILLGLTKVIENVFDIFNGNNQKNENFSIVSNSKIFRSFALIISFSIGGYLFSNIYISLILQIVIWFTILMIYDLSYQNLVENKQNTNELIELLSISFPLATTSFIISLNANVQRILVEYFESLEMLGVYSSLFFFVTATGLIVQSLGQVIAPRLAKYSYNKQYKKFTDLILKSLFIVFIIELIAMLIVSFLGKEFLTLVYSPLIAEYTNLFIIILISGMVIHLASVLGYGLTSLGLYKIQPKIFIYTLILNLIFSYFLGLILGVQGLILGLAASSFLSAMYVLKVLISEVRDRINNENHLLDE